MDDPTQLSLRALRRAVELANAWIEDLPSRPINVGATPHQMAEQLDEPLPETGTDPDSAVTEWMRRAEPGIVTSSGPRYFGFVVGGTLPAALAGDILTSTIDQNGGIWSLSPAAAQTELVVARWLKELFGLPMSWRGVMTSGATMSNLVGLAAARQWASERLGFDAAEDGLGGHPPIPVISSEAIHASARKALGNLGFGRSSVRTVPAPDGRVDVAALERELASIDGPVIVIGNGGEVNTGQFDDLKALAELCRSHRAGAWLHVDAAFGLFAAVSERYRHLVSGIELADSVCADAHKWLNVPYDSGFAFVSRPEVHAASMSHSAAYLTGSTEQVTGSSFVLGSSRRGRGFAVWAALRELGREGVADLVDRCCRHARHFAEVLTAGGARIVNDVVLNQVLVDVNADADAVAAAVREEGTCWLGATTWRGQRLLRISVSNYATTTADIERSAEAILRVAERVRAETAG